MLGISFPPSAPSTITHPLSAQLHTRHPPLVAAEPAIRRVLAALMAATTPGHASGHPDSEEEVEEAFCDGDSATPRVMTVRRSCSRVVFRLLAVDLMVRACVRACVCMCVCMCVCVCARARASVARECESVKYIR